MYIKLTKLDNTPVWLNASFIVTVEPRRGGGSIVVPIGDGLDYEVRETAEVVLGMLGSAPAPVVVPVPTKDSLTKTPADVSPDTEPPDKLKPAAPAPKPVPPVEPAPAAAPSAPEEVPDAEPAEAEKKPAKRTRKTAAEKKTAAKPRKRTAKKAAEASEEEAAEVAEKAPEPVPPSKSLTPLALDDALLERLRKMTPRTIKKLSNTLISQFGVGDPFEVIRALDERGIIKTDGGRILWMAAPAAT